MNRNELQSIGNRIATNQQQLLLENANGHRGAAVPYKLCIITLRKWHPTAQSSKYHSLQQYISLQWSKRYDLHQNGWHINLCMYRRCNWLWLELTQRQLKQTNMCKLKNKNVTATRLLESITQHLPCTETFQNTFKCCCMQQAHTASRKHVSTQAYQIHENALTNASALNQSISMRALKIKQNKQSAQLFSTAKCATLFHIYTSYSLTTHSLHHLAGDMPISPLAATLDLVCSTSEHRSSRGTSLQAWSRGHQNSKLPEPWSMPHLSLTSLLPLFALCIHSQTPLLLQYGKKLLWDLQTLL